MKRIKRWFLAGLIAVLPVILTAYFVSWVGSMVLNFIGDSFVVRHFTEYLLGLEGLFTKRETEMFVKMGVYLLTILGVFIAITMIGGTLRLVVGKKIADLFERLLNRIPVIKSIYSTLNQITSLISSEKSKSYQKVVLLEYPRRGIYSLGFLTSNRNEYFEDIIGTPELVNIFIPTSPNPTSGMFIMLPANEVKVLDMKVEEAVKLIISGGAVLPEKVNKQPKKKR